jgi:hypothetical protein
LNKVPVVANATLQQPVVEAPMTARVIRVDEERTGTAKEGDTITQESKEKKEGLVFDDSNRGIVKVSKN